MTKHIIKKDKLNYYIRYKQWLLRPEKETKLKVGTSVEIHPSPDNKFYMITQEKNHEKWLAFDDFITYISIRKQYKQNYDTILLVLHKPALKDPNYVYDDEWRATFKLAQSCKKKFLHNKRNHKILKYFRLKK